MCRQWFGLTIEQSQHLHQLRALAASNPEVAVLWLYGSQVKGNASEHSDWDLAVAFDPVKAELGKVNLY
ncbi:nucleotidyltransferase domain-containing protein [Shewanella baltica]|uniref:nucleotidyltransferase domain-containing protein n=1 Tax=Shewanella baltica TaxID=62322 RepID=UPI00217D7BD5|nr:nucleotidyltransferase domain-containing protein [Shewanella baltica]